MNPLVIDTGKYSRICLTTRSNELRIDLEERGLTHNKHVYDTLTWEQAQQLHLWLKDWCFQNRPNQQCPYPDLHHPSCTCNGEGGAR